MRYVFEERLKRVIGNCLAEVDIEELNENSNLVDDHEVTSIDIIQLVVDIEDEFEIEFPDEYLVMDKIAPYKELLAVVDELLSNAAKVAEDA